MFKIFKFTMINNLKAIWITLSIIVVSIVMTALLGSALKSMQESGVFAKEKVGVYNQIQEPYKAEFDEMLKSAEFGKILDIEYIDSIKNIEAILEDDGYHTIVVGEYTNSKNTLTLHTLYRESFILNIVSNFAQTANTISMIVEKSPSSVSALIDSYDNEVLKTIELPKGSPMGIDYYGVVSFLQLTSLLGIIAVYSILDDKGKNIFPRINTAPISKGKVILGRMLADVIYISLVLVAIAVSLRLILGVNWSGNYLVILAVFVLFSVIITLLGMISAKLTKTIFGSLGMIMGIGSVIWGRYSGAFSPYMTMGKIAYFIPNFHARNVIFATIYGGSKATIYEGLLYLVIIAFGMGMLFILLERRKTNERI